MGTETPLLCIALYLVGFGFGLGPWLALQNCDRRIGHSARSFPHLEHPLAGLVWIPYLGWSVVGTLAVFPFYLSGNALIAAAMLALASAVLVLTRYRKSARALGASLVSYFRTLQDGTDPDRKIRFGIIAVMGLSLWLLPTLMGPPSTPHFTGADQAGYAEVAQYRTRGGAIVPLVYRSPSTAPLGIIPLMEPAPDPGAIGSATSLLKAYPNSKVLFAHPGKEDRLLSASMRLLPISALV